MGAQQFANNASSTLAAAITNTSTSASLASGTGALFPTASGIGPTGTPAFWWGTFVESSGGDSPTPNFSSLEVVKVTGRATDTITIVRSQQGTTAPSAGWPSGTFFFHFPTMGTMQGLGATDDLQAQAGNYAADTGSAADVYAVSLSPALSQRVIGMPIRVKIAHTCDGNACTFNDGSGSGPAPLLTPEGGNPPAGSLKAGGIYEIIWDGTEFQAIGVHTLNFAQIAGTVSAGQVPAAAVTQYQGLLAIAASQLSSAVNVSQLTGTLPGTAAWPANITVSGTIEASSFQVS